MAASTIKKTVAKSTVQDTLESRKSTHGDFSISAQIAQDLQATMKDTPNWELLSADKKEALEMIQHKVARILTGNADAPDHWHDIAGYSTLAEDRCVPTK